MSAAPKPKPPTLPQIVPAPQPNAWLLHPGPQPDPFSATLPTSLAAVASIAEGDGVALLAERGGQPTVVAFARIYRIRSARDSVTLYFDALVPVTPPPSSIIAPPESLPLSRLDWSAFAAAVQSATGKDFRDLPPLDGKSPAQQTYLRHLLRCAVVDDLLGPANGPFEEVAGMSVRDRYLVGKLAPKTLGPVSPFAGLPKSAVKDPPPPADFQP